MLCHTPKVRGPIAGESVLSRAVRIFEVFGPDQTVLRVTDISQRTGLHVATVSRLVAELVELGLLARDDDRLVRIGMRMWELATRASPTLTLRDAAMPFMEDVHAIVGNHVQLGVLEGDDVLFIEELSARQGAISYTRLAGRLPLTVSSCGLVLLAFGDSQNEQRAVQRASGVDGATTAAAEELHAELGRVRRDGYALCRARLNRESMGVAVPVRDASGELIGSLGVVLAVDAVGTSEVPLLLAAARGISRALGSRPLANRQLPESILTE
jgi:DNA-binding IclR family transcriptional regulator